MLRILSRGRIRQAISRTVCLGLGKGGPRLEIPPYQQGALGREGIARCLHCRRTMRPGLAFGRIGLDRCQDGKFCRLATSASQTRLGWRWERRRGDAALAAADPQDRDRIDELEEQIDWDERVYRDRERSLTYVCESPVLIEKRLYAIAQMLLTQDFRTASGLHERDAFIAFEFRLSRTD